MELRGWPGLTEVRQCFEYGKYISRSHTAELKGPSDYSKSKMVYSSDDYKMNLVKSEMVCGEKRQEFSFSVLSGAFLFGS